MVFDYMTTRVLVVACGLSVPLLSALPSSAQGVSDADRAGARDAATAGLDAFKAGRYDEAIDLFNRAESIIHSPLHLLYIARAQTQSGRLVAAHETYVKVVREGGSKVADSSAEQARTELEALKPRIPKLTIRVEGADGQPFQVTMNGAAVASGLIGIPRPVDPGEYALTATAEGKEAKPANTTLAEGQNGEVVLTLEASSAAAAPAAVPPPPPAETQPAPAAATAPVDADAGTQDMKRIGAYVGFGVGAVGLGLGTVFALSASGKRSDANSKCEEETGTESCDGLPRNSPVAQEVQDLDDQADSASTMSAVGFVVGGLGVAAGVTLFILSNQDESEAASVAPWIGYKSAGVVGRF